MDRVHDLQGPSNTATAAEAKKAPHRMATTIEDVPPPESPPSPSQPYPGPGAERDRSPPPPSSPTPDEALSTPLPISPSASPPPGSPPPPPSSPPKPASPTAPASPKSPPSPIQLTSPALATPTTWITFLLVSGQNRTMAFDPDTPIARVKELVWSSWPPNWEDERPSGSSLIRLLYLGKILQDDQTLSKLRLPTHIPSNNTRHEPPRTVFHLSIRPYPPSSVADPPKKRGRRWRNRNGSEVDGDCCACVIS